MWNESIGDFLNQRTGTIPILSNQDLSWKRDVGLSFKDLRLGNPTFFNRKTPGKMQVFIAGKKSFVN